MRARSAGELTLALVIPVINHRNETLRCVDSFRATADAWDTIELLIVDNGSEPPASHWGIDDARILRNDVNAGVLPSLDEGYRETMADFVFFTHNDVVVFERGWDSKIRRVLGEIGNVGVAGFFGAKGLGSEDLYCAAYGLGQLGRVENVSGCHRMSPIHGHRSPRGEWERVAVVDGFSMIVSRRLLDELQGFDRNLPPHHNYDNHTCLQSLDRGYVNVVIAVDAHHHGGVTDVSEPWNEPFGKTKAEVHADAHYPYFYEYWRPGAHRVSLPIRVD